MELELSNEEVLADAMLELHRLRMERHHLEEDQNYWYERAVDDEKTIDDLNSVTERLNAENKKLIENICFISQKKNEDDDLK